MKKILSLALLFGALQLANAGTTNIYVENWGTGKSGVTGDGNINTVGWTGLAIRQVNPGPFMGIFTGSGINDPGTGAVLPANTAYFTVLLPNQTAPGMFYTTDTSGAGAGGNSSFVDINPTLYTNLSLSVEVQGNATDTNYIAVRVGGSWYVATSFSLSGGGTPGYPNFTNATLIYTNPANVWNTLTMNATSVTIGSVTTPSLTAPITGIGIVELPTTAGLSYNQVTVTAFTPNAPPPTPATITAPAVTPQYAPVGGGAAFLVLAGGSQPLTYIWETNGVPIHDGNKYLGTATGTLTITNITPADGLVSYSVIVTNIAGSATNSGNTLNVQTVTSDILYAEAFPYIGPNGNLAITGVGWTNAAAAGSFGIFSAGPGLGDVFSFSSTATTNLYYATDATDIGFSGLPFKDINPASYPAVTFLANFVPGNAAGQVSGAIRVYWAVQMNGAWYATAQPIPITLTALSPYLTNSFQFNPAVTNWVTVGVSGTTVALGGQPSSPLSGNITGAGLIVVHADNTGSDMNFQDFEISTNVFAGTAPSIGTSIPLAVTVYAGGGVSFGVAATGTQPFGYYWTTNNVVVQNGGRISGANGPTLTIANLTSNDDQMQIVAFVTNSAGSDNSAVNFGPTTLSVVNPPVGLIYTEAFPFVGPTVANYPIGSIGWVQANPSPQNVLFQTTTLASSGAVFAFLGTPATSLYYTTTATDTNQAGLPFPNINLASYPSLSVSVDIAPSFAASNVTAYLVVQLNNTNWYVATSPLPVPTASDSPTYSTYTTALNLAAANWHNLTVTSSGGIVGSVAAGKLSGVMTGAGLAFVTVRTGGTFNFSNFVINGTGVGGINPSAVVGGNMNLTWVGNPAVSLQSTTNLLSTWKDIPNTSGLYSKPVPVTGNQNFFRLVQH